MVFIFCSEYLSLWELFQRVSPFPRDAALASWLFPGKHIPRGHRVRWGQFLQHAL